MRFSPPSDRLDRRRRIYRWHKRNPRRMFKRGTLLHADGSVLTLDELMEWKAATRPLPDIDDWSNDPYDDFDWRA